MIWNETVDALGASSPDFVMIISGLHGFYFKLPIKNNETVRPLLSFAFQASFFLLHGGGFDESLEAVRQTARKWRYQPFDRGYLDSF